jgi:hypothetical protein
VSAIAFMPNSTHSNFISSDDEYRILRQNVFEQYAGEATTPSEVPPVSLVGQAAQCKSCLTPLNLLKQRQRAA